MPPAVIAQLDTTQIAGSTVALIVTGLLTFATLLYNGRQQRLREERARRWQIEDLARATAAAAAAVVEANRATIEHLSTNITVSSDRVIVKSLELIETVTQAAALVETKVEAATTAIREQIADNTAKTIAASTAADRAYTEANHVNNKISDLNARLLSQAKPEIH